KLVLGPGQLRWPSTPPLGGEDLPVEEELPTPHTPRLTPLERSFEAGDQGRAGGADVLGPRDVLQLLAEEHAGELAAAVVAAGVCPPGVLRGEELGFWFFGRTGLVVSGSGEVEDLVDVGCGGGHQPIPLVYWCEICWPKSHLRNQKG